MTSPSITSKREAVSSGSSIVIAHTWDAPGQKSRRAFAAVVHRLRLLLLRLGAVLNSIQRARLLPDQIN